MILDFFEILAYVFLLSFALGILLRKTAFIQFMFKYGADFSSIAMLLLLGLITFFDGNVLNPSSGIKVLMSLAMVSSTLSTLGIIMRNL